MDKKTKIWLMRQAGRYLPEYQEIRKKEKDFMSLCFNPKISLRYFFTTHKKIRFRFYYFVLRYFSYSLRTWARS